MKKNPRNRWAATIKYLKTDLRPGIKFRSSKQSLPSHTSQNLRARPRDPPGSSPIFLTPEYCHHPLTNPGTKGRLGVERYQFLEKGQGPKRGTALDWKPTNHPWLTNSFSNPSIPLLQIIWGSKTAAASFPMEQCLGGASSPFTRAAAPRLSPLRTRPSSSRHCFLHRPDTAPARTGMKRRGTKS